MLLFAITTMQYFVTLISKIITGNFPSDTYKEFIVSRLTNDTKQANTGRTPQKKVTV